MGKLQSTKVVRVWILGASICATIFVAFSLGYDFWGMKTVIDGSTNAEKTSFFGMWDKCENERKGNQNGQPLKPMVLKCEAYGDGNLAGFNEAPEFVKVTRGLLIPMVIILGAASIVIATVMYLTHNPLVTVASLPLLLSVIIGIIVLGVFLGALGHDDDFKDFTAAWAFYYFLISWFFTLSAFVASLTDRSK